MLSHQALTSTACFLAIKNGKIRWGGSRKLKIYGLLNCTSSKRMKTANRVFFATETEALQAGYRPCGHCLREKYQQWKKQQNL